MRLRNAMLAFLSLALILGQAGGTEVDGKGGIRHLHCRKVVDSIPDKEDQLPLLGQGPDTGRFIFSC